MAQQLDTLGVDIIEAGFPAASRGDFQAVSEIAARVENAQVAGLARALESDIDLAYQAVKEAREPRIHTFIATSPIHMAHKLKMRPEQVAERAEAMVAYAASKCANIEFSAEDATRSDPAFLAHVFDRVIQAGARVINIPDTVGYAIPQAYADFIMDIRSRMRYDHKALWSVHCHNDLGLAVANTLAAANCGVTQFECTINGIGERAGNAALEEIVMALNTRKDLFDHQVHVNTNEIMRTSKLLQSITGAKVQANKAIVGANAFAHESGIHQHGMLNHRETYEIMSPESVGVRATTLVLGKHSGRHAFLDKAKELGYDLTPQALDMGFKAFKALADTKKEVYDADIEAILSMGSQGSEPVYTYKSFAVNRGSHMHSMASVTLEREGVDYHEAAVGDGPVDAAFKAIEKITQTKLILGDFHLEAVTSGKDAQGKAFIKASSKGKTIKGSGVSTDIVEAAIHAYLAVINQVVDKTKEGDPHVG